MGKLSALLIVVALAGCGGNGDDIYTALSKLPRCRSWDGKVVSAKTWSNGCQLAPNEIKASGAQTCVDGRELYWNDWGWGYADDIARHHARADGQLVPPQRDLDACRGT